MKVVLRPSDSEGSGGERSVEVDTDEGEMKKWHRTVQRTGEHSRLHNKSFTAKPQKAFGFSASKGR